MSESTDSGNVGSGQEMGIGGRMVGALLSPGRTFASVNAQLEHRDWYLPMIVIVIVGMFSAYLLMSTAKDGGDAGRSGATRER